MAAVHISHHDGLSPGFRHALLLIDSLQIMIINEKILSTDTESGFDKVVLTNAAWELGKNIF